MVKCKACGGTYEPIQADGMQYFHACPPLSAAELDAAVKAGKVALPAGETVDQAVQRRTYLRANRRDENIVPAGDPTQDPTMKAAGLGVQTVAAPASTIVVVP